MDGYVGRVPARRRRTAMINCARSRRRYPMASRRLSARARANREPGRGANDEISDLFSWVRCVWDLDRMSHTTFALRSNPQARGSVSQAPVCPSAAYQREPSWAKIRTASRSQLAPNDARADALFLRYRLGQGRQPWSTRCELQEQRGAESRDGRGRPIGWRTGKERRLGYPCSRKP